MTQTLTAKMPAPMWLAAKNIGWAVTVRVVQIGRALKHRRDAMMLANFDDRALADIGLTRSDLRDAYSEPLWSDPTSMLAERAGERHAYRRRLDFGLTAGPLSAPSLVPDQGQQASNRPARYTV